MAVTSKPLIEAKHAESSATVQYTVPAGMRTLIDKFTGTNTSAAPVQISVNLVPPGGTAGASNAIAYSKTLSVGEAYTFPELCGHSLSAGSTISTTASTAGAVAIRSSGREMS